jgi:diguanylate cyclase (GGDEF)-like protein
MFDAHNEPRWMRPLSQFVLRQGFRRALLLCVAAGALAALAAAQLLAHGGAFAAPLLWAALALGGTFGAVLVLRLVFQLDAARQQHNVLATQDATTGTANRRHFMSVAQREWSRCRRYSEDGALLLIESDQARSLRDSSGADCRDALLRDITRLITQALRQPDLLARHDKHQFIAYLPNTDPLGALDVADRIRERVASHTLRWKEASLNSTVSIGVASVGATHLSLDALVRDSATALQAAQVAGGNCVRAAPIQPRAAASPPRTALRGRPR